MLASRLPQHRLLARLVVAVVSLAVIHADPIMDICLPGSCTSVMTFLDPCGGGATNTSLQHELVYTPTPILGSCQCNVEFFNSFSSCLACIASQKGQAYPQIESQDLWLAHCKDYGFNYTNSPVNFTLPTNGDDASTAGKLGVGVIIGIAVGGLTALAALGAVFVYVFKNNRKKRRRNIFERPYSSTSANPAHHEEGGGASNYHNTDYNNNLHGGYRDDNDGYENVPHDQQRYPYQDYHVNQSNLTFDSEPNDVMLMNSLQSPKRSSYLPTTATAAILPPPAGINAVVVGTGAVGGIGALPPLGSARPADTMPQNLRTKPKDWDEGLHQQQLQQEHALASDLVSRDVLLGRNDKAALDESDDDLGYHNHPSSSAATATATAGGLAQSGLGYDEFEPLEPPRARDRFRNDREEYLAGRRSMTPPRANLRSYGDDFERPSYERERRHSGSDRGSVSGLNLVRGGVHSPSGLQNQRNSDDENGTKEDENSPEAVRRRRAAELFSAEGSRT
ncbi:hypothetical protein BGW38_008424 [Lunasporangiospora selenospora]|uniref:Transmembrane protein n=1 Tax=Lunasporangiospora selenospora TaxID=979761 RepID=A0A9P6G379_9FUNG|nr:hypothetical protein BGW38_008424 [Lunasporangiospora selenospora]